MKRLPYFCLCMLLVVGCARPAQTSLPRNQLTLTDGFGDPTSLNPYLEFAWPTSVVTSELALAFLFREGRGNNSLEPDLAAEIPTYQNGGVSANGLRISYRLRPNLRWSDGAPLTSKDLAFTIDVILNPKNNIASDGFTDITRVETPDARTAVFYLKRPFGDFLSTFFTTGGPSGPSPILPEHAFKSTAIANAPFNDLPIGAGPYRVVAWHRSNDIAFERNPFFWGNPAKIQSLRYLINKSIQTASVEFSSHEVQLWERIPESKIDDAKHAGRVILTAPDAYLHLDFNVQRSAVQDRAVRRAILLALDRAALVRDVSHGYGLLQEGVVSVTNPIAARLPLQKQDVAEAQRLLAGRHPSIVLTYPSGDEMLSSMAELIRSQLAQVGVALEVHGYDPAYFYSSVLPKGNWDAAMFNWTLDNSGNVQTLFSCSNIAPAGQNYMHYCNSKLDGLFSRFDDTYSVHERRFLLRREEDILDADVPTIVLFFRQRGYGVAKGVTGFDPRPDAPLDGFETVHLAP